MNFNANSIINTRKLLFCVVAYIKLCTCNEIKSPGLTFGFPIVGYTLTSEVIINCVYTPRKL